MSRFKFEFYRGQKIKYDTIKIVKKRPTKVDLGGPISRQFFANYTGGQRQEEL